MRGYGTETLDTPTYLYGAGTARPECTAPNPACVWAAPMPATVPPTPPTLVPNWNHPYVLARMQALLQAVAAALGDTSELSASAERRLGDRIAASIYRDPDYLDDPLLLEYVQAIWNPLVASAKQLGQMPGMGKLPGLGGMGGLSGLGGLGGLGGFGKKK